MSKIVKLDSVLNVRDFGGQGVSGGRIARGKLYRGAQLSTMSGRDRDTFSKWGVSLLVDMRYRSERARQKTELCDVFNPEILVMPSEHDLDGDNVLAPHEQFVLQELHTAADGARYMTGTYKERPHRPGFVSLLSQSFRRLSKGEDVLYVHCAAGKDRTGCFAAFLLMALGASADDVMEDYMRTQQAVELELFLGMIATKLEARYGRTYTPESLRPFLTVESEYLQYSLEAVGDMETYWHDTLGLNLQELDALRAHYIV